MKEHPQTLNHNVMFVENHSRNPVLSPSMKEHIQVWNLILVIPVECLSHFPGNLNDHENTHTGVKPYACDTCGKSFVQSCTRTIHQITHTGVKPYTCDNCGKSLSHSSTLTNHEQTHTGVKPYTCEICGKSFARSGNLNEHERTHTGAKTYTCDTCGNHLHNPVHSSGMKEHTQTLNHNVVMLV